MIDDAFRRIIIHDLKDSSKMQIFAPYRLKMFCGANFCKWIIGSFSMVKKSKIHTKIATRELFYQCHKNKEDFPLHLIDLHSFFYL